MCFIIKVKYHPDGPEGEEIEIDFTPPFARVPMIATLEKVLNVKLPPADQLNTPEANALLSELCQKNEVNRYKLYMLAQLFKILLILYFLNLVFR